MRIAKLISLFTVAALLSVYVSAQTGTSSLRGTITDPKGAVIPGATVTLSNPQTGYSRIVKSSDQGVYQFLEVPPATYSMQAKAPGFATTKQDNLPLMVNTPATLDVTLTVAGGRNRGGGDGGSANRKHNGCQPGPHLQQQPDLVSTLRRPGGDQHSKPATGGGVYWE